MHRNDALYRSDRALFAVLAVLCMTFFTALGAALTYRPEAIAIPQGPHILTEQEQMLADLAAEHRCLSQALYYEARGEGPVGQKAVAEVVFHRMYKGNFGHSICAVVYEGASRPGCQFSFTCNGDLKRPREEAAWLQSEELAAQILTGAVRLANSTGGATNYHAVYVSPVWAPTLKKTAQIGNHIFYRTPARSRDS
jgi:spore germination cell wall hydrolase CwlJ-like protein